MVGRVGVEPTVYQSCLIYSQVPSPAKHTDPYGAHSQIRTGDLFLTKEVLYLLSYVSRICGPVGYRSKNLYRMFLPFKLIPVSQDAGFEPTPF